MSEQVADFPSFLVEPANLTDLDIPHTVALDLVLRLLAQEGRVSLRQFADVIGLNAQLLDDMLATLQREHLVEVSGSGQLGRLSYTYSFTDAGRERGAEAFARSSYLGPAPVPFEKYNRAIMQQTEHRRNLSPEEAQAGLDHLVLADGFERRIGPAVNDGTSLFLYGPPGNGKTTIAEAIGAMITGAEPIWLPYALSVGTHIINLNDALIHKPVPFNMEGGTGGLAFDRRWGLFERPIVIAGGELTMDAMDLRYDPNARFYEAPLQLKANGGMFLIDDFGRQVMRPLDLLNRWIVPLETGIDFLRLRTGQSMQVPFRQLIVFSTNLDPLDLADEAFLRRIQYKVLVEGPDERMYFQVFARICQQYGIELNKDAFLHLLQAWYRDTGRPMQAVHPRDILKILISLCEFEGVEPHMTPQLIDEACAIYFVEGEVDRLT